MTDFNEKLLNIIKNRKITKKSLKDIRNKKNTPKDFNILNEFLKANQNKTNNNKNFTTNANIDENISDENISEGYNIEESSFQDYCNNNSLLQFDNIKKYNSLIRLLNGAYLNKWKPLYRRLLLSSKLNSEINTELSIRLKNDANWLKINSKELILMNNSNIYDKTSPSLQNLKNYKVCMSPKYNLHKNILVSKNDYLIKAH